jgi:hypothetical protein
MSTVLQSEIRLHEGILASLTLQSSSDSNAANREEVTARMEQAIANLKDAVRSDETGAQRERLLHLLFNLQEMIAAFKISLQSLTTDVDSPPPDALSNGIEWMEDLAEAWSLSLDEAFMSDVKGRLTTARPASEIRDWRHVLGELDQDAEVQN